MVMAVGRPLEFLVVGVIMSAKTSLLRPIHFEHAWSNNWKDAARVLKSSP